jgi:molybdate transport system substrate-binding protein
MIRPLLHRLLFLCAASVAALPVQADEITVFAAASLKTALDAVAADWRTATGTKVTISYGGTPTLAKQIEQGAPADIFISASPDWMDTLQKNAKIETATRRDLFGNTLVLVAHDANLPLVNMGPDLDLAGMLAGGKLSMALVDSVPAGQYGKAALEHLGLWSSVQANVVQSENVRAALSLVALGEAPLGIVYGSDAIADDGAENAVSVIGTFPSDSHPPITYPAALVADHDTPGAAAFLDHLSSDAADAIFATQGFLILN